MSKHTYQNKEMSENEKERGSINTGRDRWWIVGSCFMSTVAAVMKLESNTFETMQENFVTIIKSNTHLFSNHL